VDLAKVAPAFTSVIGRMKSTREPARSRHQAAALAIGRAAQGYGVARQSGPSFRDNQRHIHQ